MDRNNKQSWCGGCVEVFSMREISKAWGEKRLLPELRSGHERGDGMRAWCGFATLCAIGLLGGDAIVGASIGKVAFHVALLIVNLVCYLRVR